MTEPSSSCLQPPLGFDLPYAFHDGVIDRKNSAEEVSCVWEVLAKVVQYVSGAILIGLGAALLTYIVIIELAPIVFSGVVLAGVALAGAGLWFLFKDVCKSSYPIQKAVENLSHLHQRLSPLVPDDVLFKEEDIPSETALQPIFEYIDKFKGHWEKEALLTNADWPCDIVKVDTQVYLSLPLMIGQGNKKPVYVGINADSGDLVAISRAHIGLQGEEGEEKQSFLDILLYPNVAQALKDCRPEANRGGVLPIYHCLNVTSDEGKEQFLIQKLCMGGDLQARLAQMDRPMTLGQKKAIAEDLFTGLLKMHRAGLLHKDIKPTNVFLDLDARAFWGDFDFTIREADVVPGRDGIPDPLYERKKMLNGNHEYEAPETYAAGQIDQKSEVYSLGLILYGLFMGIPPLAVREISDLIDNEESLELSYEIFGNWLPWETAPPENSLDYLLAKMMWPIPGDRYSLEKAYEEFLKIPEGNLVLSHVIDSEKRENFIDAE